jgi:hypothetical protein
MHRGLLVLAALMVSACGGNTPQVSDQDQPAPAQREAITYRSEDHGYEVTYSPDWHIIGERLTPNLDDPREILALATYEAPPGGNRCQHQPVAALEALGPADALIVVFERRPPWPDGRYPPREPADAHLERGTGRFCVPDRDRLDAWYPFGDLGRGFYLLVAVGPEASPRTHRDVTAILESLTFQAA